MSRYWLFKTEPSTYSFAQLLRERKTPWNGVRNFQARNFLKEAKKGDLAVIYHSGDERAAVGVARVAAEAYPDPDPAKPGDWVQIDLEAVESFTRCVALSTIKSEKELREIPLIRQSRLSCMPITEAHFKALLKLGGRA